MAIEIENIETHEVRLLEKLPSGFYPNFGAPWKIKQIARLHPAIQNNEKAAKLSTMLSGWGLPLSMTLTAIRWLLGNDCPFCQVGGEFLKLLEDGKIGEAECKELVIQVLNAKDQNDEVGLAALKGRLEELRNSI